MLAGTWFQIVEATNYLSTRYLTFCPEQSAEGKMMESDNVIITIMIFKTFVAN